MKELANILKNMVPAERLELSWAQGPRDFESRASTSFTTPAAKTTKYQMIKLKVQIKRNQT